MGKAKLEKKLQAQIDAGKPVFVPYIMGGDSGLDNLASRIQFLEEAGATAIEVGIPFSDPVADGPIIQDAGIRALKDGVSLSGVLNTLKEQKTSRSIPVVIMTYLNPIFVFGVDRFASACADAGVDGVIIPDIPMEEEELVAPALKEADIAFIRLAAMTSPEERLKKIAKRSEGFLYAVAVAGTTGARTTHEDRVTGYLADLKKHSNVPVLAGFGVSTPAQAHQLSEVCDGVIVGSKIVDLFHQGKSDEVKQLIKASVEKQKV